MTFWKRKDSPGTPAFTYDPAKGQSALPPSASGTAVRFVIEDVYLMGGGLLGPIVVLVGHSESGVVHVGQKLRLTPGSGSKSSPRDIEVVSINAHHKSLQSVSLGEQVGMMVKGLGKHDARKGDYLVSG